MEEVLVSLKKSSGNEFYIQYKTLHKVLGEGTFVLAVSKGTWQGKHASIYDLYRVEKGKIVEHWDVIEDIPPRENWKNNNGKFWK